MISAICMPYAAVLCHKTQQWQSQYDRARETFNTNNYYLCSYNNDYYF